MLSRAIGKKHATATMFSAIATTQNRQAASRPVFPRPPATAPAAARTSIGSTTSVYTRVRSRLPPVTQ